jgi:hypothetical protein
MPKYLVTLSPGAPVPDVGFVKAGQMFNAPESYVPSLTFRPCDPEAKKILEATFDEQKRVLKTRLERADKRARVEDSETIQTQLDDLERQRAKNCQIYAPTQEPPKIEDAMSLKELGELEAQAQAQVGVGPGERKVPKASPEKADRKL